MNTINLNDYVWVRLNEKGEQILHRSWNRYPELQKMSRSAIRRHHSFQDGWWQFQLHHLMHVFGPVFGAPTFDIPFETTHIKTINPHGGEKP